MENKNSELDAVISILQEQGSMNFMPEASDLLISAFEFQNGVTLPAKYKEWLLFSDGGECFLPAGVQFYGVTHKPTIDINYNDRPDDSFIVIGALASGDPVLCEKGSERICIYNHEAGRIEDDEIFEDFFDFLRQLGETLGTAG